MWRGWWCIGTKKEPRLLLEREDNWVFGNAEVDRSHTVRLPAPSLPFFHRLWLFLRLFLCAFSFQCVFVCTFTLLFIFLHSIFVPSPEIAAQILCWKRVNTQTRQTPALHHLNIHACINSFLCKTREDVCSSFLCASAHTCLIRIVH